MSQACHQNVIKTTPNHHFKINNDGTVTDKATNLMWKTCSEGQTWNSTECTGSATDHNWKQALQIPAILNVSGGYAGYTDWRLPNINELQSIAELSCYQPAINESVFFNTPSENYWSSSSRHPSPGSNVTSGFNGLLNFKYGNVDFGTDREYQYKVRLVRNLHI